jgi:hypothetical protein
MSDTRPADSDEREPNAFIGGAIVRSESTGMPVGETADPEPEQPFDIAAEQTRLKRQLEVIDVQLEGLVDSRTRVNAEIKALRDRREAVERMFNATKPRTRKPRATTSKAD